MCHQATWTRWFMITLIAFLWLIFTMCFHTYVSSEHLAVSTQIYIGCIYLVYLHCVSSSVLLNGQLEKMHSCVCCNWIVFRHYAFSNVGTTHFYNCMHSHTVFHQMCPEMVSLRRCTVALVTIEWSFATMPFQMLAQSISITACIVTLITFLWLFHCVSSNASLNGQLEKLHSCTRCNWKCIAKCRLKVFGSEHA